MCQDDINPGDSVSNVSSKRSSRKGHFRSYVSSTSSARLKARAEKVALLEQATALKRRHELEAQEDKLRQERDKLRKLREQLELDTQIAAAAARLSVLEGSDIGGKTHSDGMNSYVSKGLNSIQMQMSLCQGEIP